MDDRRRTAIHETGHLLAVLACPWLPQPTAASVVPDPETHGRLEWPLDLAQRTLNPYRLEEAVVVLLAGLAAEERGFGQSVTLEEAGAGGDLRTVARLLVAHGVTGDAADALVKRATARARGLVARVWPLLEAVAGVLERVGTLGPEGIASTRGGLLALVNVRQESQESILDTLKRIDAEQVARSAVSTARKAPMPRRPWDRA